MFASHGWGHSFQCSHCDETMDAWIDKRKKDISQAIFTGISDRLHLAPVHSDTVCLHVKETGLEMRHYHNKVGLAPFFHQAPVPHALLPHGDPCDHTLVQLRVKEDVHSFFTTFFFVLFLPGSWIADWVYQFSAVTSANELDDTWDGFEVTFSVFTWKHVPDISKYDVHQLFYTLPFHDVEITLPLFCCVVSSSGIISRRNIVIGLFGLSKAISCKTSNCV